MKALRLLALHRSTGHYVLRVRADLAQRQQISAIADARSRVGHRRIYILLRREGYPVGDERIRRPLTVVDIFSRLSEWSAKTRGLHGFLLSSEKCELQRWPNAYNLWPSQHPQDGRVVFTLRA